MTRVISSNRLPVPEKPSMDDIEITTCPFVSTDSAFTSSISCFILVVILRALSSAPTTWPNRSTSSIVSCTVLGLLMMTTGIPKCSSPSNTSLLVYSGAMTKSGCKYTIFSTA